MTQSSRKFWGNLLIVLLIIVYAALAVVLYEALVAGWPNWAQLVYFIVAGLGWALPAGALIQWMSKPDA